VPKLAEVGHPRNGDLLKKNGQQLIDEIAQFLIFSQTQRHMPYRVSPRS
jgi:hypothetical protein